MTKRYVLSREDLQNLMHESITFFSEKAQEVILKNQRIMFSDRIRWIEEFLDKFIHEFPIDKLVDELEKATSSFTGRTVDEIKNDVKKLQPEYEERMDKIKNYNNQFD